MRKEHQQAALFTIALHAALLAMLLFSGFRLVVPPPKGHGGISAELVDLSQWTASPKKAPQPKKSPKTHRQPKATKPKPQPAKKKVAPKKPPAKPVVTRKKTTPKKAVKPKPAVNTRARDLQRQKDAERRRKLEAIRQQRLEAERQRKLETERLKQLEAKNKSTKQTPPQTATAAGTEKGVEKAKNVLLARYVESIKTRVARNWARPPTTPKNLRCRVKVKQIPGGNVIDVTIASPCNGDALVQKSIINAVKRSDPLPYTGFEDVFERSLSFTFTYDGES